MFRVYYACDQACLLIQSVWFFWRRRRGGQNCDVGFIYEPLSGQFVLVVFDFVTLNRVQYAFEQAYFTIRAHGLELLWEHERAAQLASKIEVEIDFETFAQPEQARQV